MKLRTMRLTGHVARMRAKRITYNVGVGNHEGNAHYESLYANGRIILKRILREIE
jgi:hypothetical protein